MNKISPFLRRCLLLLPLALMVASDSTAQRFEQRIVFASNRDGDWDIYSMDVMGDNLVQLTDHPASDEVPACSPDGRRIAFTSERGVTHDLYVMDSDGSNVIRLTQNNFFESRASWSPDGTRIAFSSSRFHVGNSEIYVMDANGENEINLTEHKMHDIVPSWSPDGSKIAFVGARVARNAPFHIFVMNADGTGRRNLTGDSDLTRSFFPTWSPDGKKIVFDSQHIFAPGLHYHIYGITAEGEELERLTVEGNRGASPVYVLDGSKIAYVSRRGGDYNIYLMDTNGKNVVKLTKTPPGIDNKDPYWSPGALAVNPNGKLPISWGVLKRTGKPR